MLMVEQVAPITGRTPGFGLTVGWSGSTPAGMLRIAVAAENPGINGLSDAGNGGFGDFVNAYIPDVARNYLIEAFMFYIELTN